MTVLTASENSSLMSWLVEAASPVILTFQSQINLFLELSSHPFLALTSLAWDFFNFCFKLLYTDWFFLNHVRVLLVWLSYAILHPHKSLIFNMRKNIYFTKSAGILHLLVQLQWRLHEFPLLFFWWSLSWNKCGQL